MSSKRERQWCKVDYTKHGFPNRKAYLQDLAESYELTFDSVLKIANRIGAANDFGRLIQELKIEQEVSQQCISEEGFAALALTRTA